MGMNVVLQRYLAMCGVASRRKSEDLILNNKVKINGRHTKLGDRVNVGEDVVTVDGKKIVYNSGDLKRYIMLNKPRGYVTTMKDEKNRKCVADLVKDVGTRIFPVGRLDRNSEGLLIMTNDGDFANYLMHPSHCVWKTYRVTVKQNVSEEQLVKLSKEFFIDGVKTNPAKVSVVFAEKGRIILNISIREGRNRQIRKMCEMVGLNVARLKRISIGDLKLGELKIGKWRDLTLSEIKLLKNK